MCCASGDKPYSLSKSGLPGTLGSPEAPAKLITYNLDRHETFTVTADLSSPFKPPLEYHETLGTGNKTPTAASVSGRARSVRSSRSIQRSREILAALPVSKVTLHLPPLPTVPPEDMQYTHAGSEPIVAVDLSADSDGVVTPAASPIVPKLQPRRLNTPPPEAPSSVTVQSTHVNMCVEPYCTPHVGEEKTPEDRPDRHPIDDSDVKTTESVVAVSAVVPPSVYREPPEEAIEVLGSDSTFAAKVQEAMSLAVHYTVSCLLRL